MRRTHKYIGLPIALFILWMTASGIVLNHREWFSTVEVGRHWLPDAYKYRNWNRGFIKEALRLDDTCVLYYGNEGIWESQHGLSPTERTEGLASGADQRKIHRLVHASDSLIYAVSSFRLYRLDPRLDKQPWETVVLPAHEGLITDLECQGDTLAVLTRSGYILADLSERPIRFQYATLPDSPDLPAHRSLFETFWELHGGNLFGLAGRLAVDTLGLLLSFIGVSGLLIWGYKRLIRSRKERGKRPSLLLARRFGWQYRQHNLWGQRLIVPFLVLTLTGACLRPPLLIPLSRIKTAPIPFTTMDSDNPWHERLRSFRYDRQSQEWLLYTSEGFFTATSLDQPARRVKHEPPVSVMGVNVLEPLGDGQWLVGSFSGLFRWDRARGSTIDLYTNEAPRPRRIPISERMISGAALDGEWTLFDYNKGATGLKGAADFPEMPDRLASRPMALWNLALEMHTGRYFTCLGSWSLVYPFLLGLALIVALLSGWKIRKRRK